MGRGAGGAGGRAGIAGGGSRSREAPIDWDAVDKGKAPLPVGFNDLTVEELESSLKMIGAHGEYNAFKGEYGDFGPGGKFANMTEAEFAKEFPEVLETTQHFNSLLSKLPNRPGVTYHRGEFETLADFNRFIESRTPGSVITNGGFLYTHRNQVNSYGFSKPNRRGMHSVRIYVDGKRGKDIGPYFNAPVAKALGVKPQSKRAENMSRIGQRTSDRQYTLFKPGSKFRVTKAGRAKDNVYEIHYEEI